MNTNVTYEVTDLHNPSRSQRGSFSFGRELAMQLSGLRSGAVMDSAADLLEIGASFFRIERQLTSAPFIRTAKRGKIHFRVRKPSPWQPAVVKRLEMILGHLGNITWEVTISGGASKTVYGPPGDRIRPFKRVVLFSGGLDSACGATLIDPQDDDTILFGYYTRRKAWQMELANELGPFPLVQLSETWHGEKTRGRSFYYRALFFLFAAGAVASASGAREIWQCENGILSLAIPPAASVIMTRHATPWLQGEVGRLFDQVLGGSWVINNPLLGLTKRQAFQEARRRRRAAHLNQLFKKTDSCWSFNAITSMGGTKRRKPRGIGCGRCVSCIVRHTVFPDEEVSIDLRKDALRNHAIHGAFLRSFAGFLSDVEKTESADEFWYRLVPADHRQWIESSRAISRDELWHLHRRFAREFFSSYELST